MKAFILFVTLLSIHCSSWAGVKIILGPHVTEGPRIRFTSFEDQSAATIPEVKEFKNPVLPGPPTCPRGFHPVRMPNGSYICKPLIHN